MSSPQTNNGCVGCGKNKIGAQAFGRARKLPDGSILYQKKGWEPPPVPDGYKRDPSNAWRFVPVYPPCDFRIQAQKMKPCGAIHLITVCNCPDCPLRRQDVSEEQCNACTFRESSHAV